MNQNELFAIIDDLKRRLKHMEKKMEVQEKELKYFHDIEDIKRLQRAYGYYIEHWMNQEIIDLFSDGPDVSLTLGAGTYLGKEGVKRYFNHINKAKNPEFLHQVMQLSGMIDIAADGKTARGRWYGYGAVAFPRPEGVRQGNFSGIYGCEYVKEEGIWKIKKLRFDESYSAIPAKGWVRPERLATGDRPQYDIPVIPGLKVDVPRKFNTRYPSDYIQPFHFSHPVTGNPTSEEERNKKRNFESFE